MFYNAEYEYVNKLLNCIWVRIPIQTCHVKSPKKEAICGWRVSGGGRVERSGQTNCISAERECALQEDCVLAAHLQHRHSGPRVRIDDCRQQVEEERCEAFRDLSGLNVLVRGEHLLPNKEIFTSETRFNHPVTPIAVSREYGFQNRFFQGGLKCSWRADALLAPHCHCWLGR